MSNWYIYNKKDNYKVLDKYAQFTTLQKKILANRNIIDEIDLNGFINPSIEGLHDPYLMNDMENIIERIVEAISNEEKIRIVGDYDQDGVAATTILMKGIGYFYKNISYDIPDRIEDGYGLNNNIIKKAKKDGVTLMITCDNGITSIDEVLYGRSLGIDIIVTDHHNPKIGSDGSEQLPETLILNPKVKESQYPFKELCGAGVAFKLVEALFFAIGEDSEYLYDLLQFAALGTICDVVDLVGENRIIAIEGLKVLNKRENLGIDALLRASSWEREITYYTVGFIIGPSINSSGRIFDARLGVELFLSNDKETYEQYAYELYSLNNERKEMTKNSFEDIDSNLSPRFGIIIEYNENIHESICGLVAGRLKDKYYLPTVVFTESEDNKDMLKASGRSVKEFNMFENLSKYKNYFTSFGGHDMACGLSIEKSKFKEFKGKIEEEFKNNRYEKTIDIDAQIPIDSVNFDLIDEIEKLSPFGKGNEKPLFADKNVKIVGLSMIGKNSDVMKLTLEKNNRMVEGIIFSANGDFDYLENKFGKNLSLSINRRENNNYIDIVYFPQINEFRGNRNIQIGIKEIR